MTPRRRHPRPPAGPERPRPRTRAEPRPRSSTRGPSPRRTRGGRRLPASARPHGSRTTRRSRRRRSRTPSEAGSTAAEPDRRAAADPGIRPRRSRRAVTPSSRSSRQRGGRRHPGGRRPRAEPTTPGRAGARGAGAAEPAHAEPVPTDPRSRRHADSQHAAAAGRPRPRAAARPDRHPRPPRVRVAPAGEPRPAARRPALRVARLRPRRRRPGRPRRRAWTRCARPTSCGCSTTSRTPRPRAEQDVRDEQAIRDRLLSGSGSSAAAQEAAQRRLDTLGHPRGHRPRVRTRASSWRSRDPRRQVDAPVLLDTLEELRDGGAEVDPDRDVRVVAATAFTDDAGRRPGRRRGCCTPPYTLQGDRRPADPGRLLQIPGGVLDVAARARVRRARCRSPPDGDRRRVADPRRGLSTLARPRARRPDQLRPARQLERTTDGRLRVPRRPALHPEHEWVRGARAAACGWASPRTRRTRSATSSSCPCPEPGSTVDAGAAVRRGRVDQERQRPLRPGQRHGRGAQRGARRDPGAGQLRPLRAGMDVRGRAGGPGCRRRPPHARTSTAISCPDGRGAHGGASTCRRGLGLRIRTARPTASRREVAAGGHGNEETAMTEPDAGAAGEGDARRAAGPDGPAAPTRPCPCTRSARSRPRPPSRGCSAADRTAIEALPPGSALLVVQRGPNSGARFLLDADKTTAGRRPDSDIFLDDVTVSRKHAEFVRKPGGVFVVRDVGSLNGTYVQRDRIDEVVAARRRRGADRQVPDGLPPEPAAAGPTPGGERRWPMPSAGPPARGRTAPMSIGEVLAALRPEFPDVTHLEDPLPRGAGSRRPGPHAVGLPQVRPRRRGAAALHPVRCSATTTCRCGSSATTSPRSTPGRTRRRCPGAPRVPRLVAAPPSRRRRAERVYTPRAARGRRRTRRRAAGGARVLRPGDRAARRALRRRRAGRRCARPPASRAFGIEPRHLRPFRTAADREADLVEQVVAPAASPARPGGGGPRRRDRPRGGRAVRAAARRARLRRPEPLSLPASPRGRRGGWKGRRAPQGCEVR